MRTVPLALLLLIPAALAQAAEAVEDQCRQRVEDYAWFWDHVDREGFADLFTEDAKLTLGQETWRGRSAIVERMADKRGPVMRHLVSTVRISADGDGTATGVSYVTVYAAEPVDRGLPEVDGFALIGEYHDTFRISADGCRIAERKLVPVMRQRR